MSRLLFCSWEVIILENSLQNYQEKAAGEIIGTQSSQGIEVIKKGLFASIRSGHQTAQFLENQQNLLAMQPLLLFVHASIG